MSLASQDQFAKISAKINVTNQFHIKTKDVLGVNIYSLAINKIRDAFKEQCIKLVGSTPLEIVNQHNEYNIDKIKTYINNLSDVKEASPVTFYYNFEAKFFLIFNDVANLGDLALLKLIIPNFFEPNELNGEFVLLDYVNGDIIMEQI